LVTPSVTHRQAELRAFDFVGLAKVLVLPVLAQVTREVVDGFDRVGQSQACGVPERVTGPVRDVPIHRRGAAVAVVTGKDERLAECLAGLEDGAPPQMQRAASGVVVVKLADAVPVLRKRFPQPRSCAIGGGQTLTCLIMISRAESLTAYTTFNALKTN